MWTTVPPAKSSAPKPSSQPPSAQTQWATGAYTMVTHKVVNTTKALNFIRSAKAPVIRAGVMIANIPWKIMNACAGILASGVAPSEALTPAKPKLSKPPIKPPMSGPKANV